LIFRTEYAAKRRWPGRPCGSTIFIRRTWAGLGQPCSEEAVRQALDCAERRIAAHDSTRAVLVHGDVHEWNALCTQIGVQPQGRLILAAADAQAG